MPSPECTAIDRPTRDAVPVVDLLERDAGGHDDVFHLRRVLKSSVRTRVKRLDEHATAAVCQAGTYERSRIVNAQQSSLDTNTAG